MKKKASFKDLKIQELFEVVAWETYELLYRRIQKTRHGLDDAQKWVAMQIVIRNLQEIWSIQYDCQRVKAVMGTIKKDFK